MNLPNHSAAALADFPAVLRALIEAELAAGNELEEICHGFPAPPVGACARMRRSMITNVAERGGELSFCAWPNWDRRTGYTDAKGHFFVLNPPQPPPPVPDMDAIRDAANRPASQPPRRDSAALGGAALQRFQESMVIDYVRWHDGIGYDLEAIRTASATDRAAIERLLLRRGMKDWRDVEALAEFDSTAAVNELRSALEHSGPEISMAVLQHAARIVTPAMREAALLRALQHATIYGGLTGTISEIVNFHPPAIVAAVLRGCLERSGEVAGHLAGLALFLHGKAKSVFDWEHRPLLLQFNTPDRRAREAAYRELLARIAK